MSKSSKGWSLLSNLYPDITASFMASSEKSRKVIWMLRPMTM
jgi:hypothetical protein